MNKPIGILGGTFDPIHYGHLKPAQQILQRIGLAEIRLMPSHIPPHKEGTHATSAQRAEMAQLACQDMPGFSVDLRELERDDPSYTVVTLQALRASLPDTPICFMMGMDSFLAIKFWHRWEEILQLCHLIVSHRPGFILGPQRVVSHLLDDHQVWKFDELHQQNSGLIHLSLTDELDISSTQIRENIKAGISNEGLLPESVAQYILQQGLYK